MTAPHAWALVELESLTPVAYGKALSASMRAEDGVVPVIGSSGVVGRHNEALVDGPCLVIGRKGAAGAVHLVNQSSWPIDTAYFIQPPRGIDLRYLYYFLGSQQLGQLDKSTAIPSLSRDDLYRVKVPVAPESEQVRIVEKLEELLSDLDAGVAELKAAQRKLAQYRQSLLRAAVEGALTADWRAAHGKPQETGAELLQRILSERRARWEQKQLAKFAEQGKEPPKGWQAKYPEPVAPDLADLPALPDGWAWASVDQLSVSQKYGSSAKTIEESGGVPVLRMGNIQDGEIDLESLKYLPASHPEFPDLLLEDGDLLFNRTNSPELVGKTAIYRSQVFPCSYASYLIGVRLSAWCIPELVAAFINSAYGRRWVKSVVTQQVGQANVNGTKLAALAVPLAPFEEQQVIAQILSSQRQNAAHQAQMADRGLKQAAAQRKNLLKTAFAGQLVPQDPDDEPASALLEHIRARAQPTAGTAGKRGRKARETV